VRPFIFFTVLAGRQWFKVGTKSMWKDPEIQRWLPKECKKELGVVIHTYNPSYMGGRGRKIFCSKQKCKPYVKNK
jgi:hypothetical protein